MGCKLLFIRLSSLGDVILTEPAVRLAKSTPHSIEVHYLTKPLYADIVRDFEGVDKVYLWENKINLLKTLRAEKYDYVIDLHNKFNTFLIKRLISAKKTITYKKQHFLRQLIVRKLSKESIDSVVGNYLAAVERIDIRQQTLDSRQSNASHIPSLKANEETVKTVNTIFENYRIPTDKSLIGIFPGATHQTKQYPVEKMVNFLLDIPDDWQCAILIMGDWKDKLLALRLKSMSGMNIYDLTGAFDTRQLVAAISKLDIVITNDSGPMHIAAALKKPQIAIFGATHTRLGFRPLNENAVIIQKDLPCQPCSLHGGKACHKRHFRCMNTIHSGELFETFKAMYEKVITDH